MKNTDLSILNKDELICHVRYMDSDCLINLLLFKHNIDYKIIISNIDDTSIFCDLYIKIKHNTFVDKKLKLVTGFNFKDLLNYFVEFNNNIYYKGCLLFITRYYKLFNDKSKNKILNILTYFLEFNMYDLSQIKIIKRNIGRDIYKIAKYISANHYYMKNVFNSNQILYIIKLNNMFDKKVIFNLFFNEYKNNKKDTEIKQLIYDNINISQIMNYLAKYDGLLNMLNFFRDIFTEKTELYVLKKFKNKNIYTLQILNFIYDEYKFVYPNNKIYFSNLIMIKKIKGEKTYD